MGKTTDNLINCMNAAVQRKEYLPTLAKIEEWHMTVIGELIPTSERERVTKNLQAYLEELKVILGGMSCLQEASDRSRARVVSFGERMSASIISEILKPEIPDTDWCDARHLIKTDDKYLSAEVDIQVTTGNVREFFKTHNKTLFITTGFIASTGEGVQETTTLGRGGSDYTASILGALLSSSLILIWTDVDGVFTADPRKVAAPLRIPSMSFQEAMELSFFGAKVIYAPTMGPAMACDIPMQIKSTFLPDGEGTVITKNVVLDSEWMVRGITSISEVCVVLLEGCGIVGVAGVSGRTFTALNRERINVIVISQASSEHSICFAVEPHAGAAAKQALEQEFEIEIQKKLIDGVTLMPEMCCVAVVGDGMVAKPGIFGRLASSLGKHMINITVVAQGSSERNISVLIPKSDEKKALNCIHDTFFSKKIITNYVFVVGTGRVGSALFPLLEEGAEKWEKKHSLRIVVAGIINHDLMLMDYINGIDKKDWQNRLQSCGEPSNMEEYLNRILETDFGHSTLVDCSNGIELAQCYEVLLQKGVHVISCNKTSAACPLDIYQRLHSLSGSVANPTYMYTSALDPVLPIVPALRSFVFANQIQKVEVNFSCTLSFVFSRVGEGLLFSEAAQLAQAKGLCETDPRHDFSGADFRRRMTLVCRAAGSMMEVADIKLKAFISDDVEIATLFDALKAHDDDIKVRKEAAEAQGKVLRYIGRFDLRQGTATVDVEALEEHDPLASTESMCLCVHTASSSFGTTQPIVMSSPPSMPEHVAGSLIRDLLAAAGSH
jgi:aspartokinase/homoserine dehydrogenase 1